MLKALIFFTTNINKHQLIFLLTVFVVHVFSYAWYLKSERDIVMNILQAITQSNDTEFLDILIKMIITNIICLAIYTVTALMIEIVGKIAVKTAVDHSSIVLLNTELNTVTKKEYERKVLSIVHHSENVTSAIRNLFIEFPRKIIITWYFLSAVYNINLELMVYCVLVNIAYVSVNIFISRFRIKLLGKITEQNITFSVISSDIATSIQSHKIDNRITEYKNKIEKISTKIWYNSSLDSMMTTSSETLTNISSQFMLGIFAYVCRPYIISGVINPGDFTYGIRLSSKFIEKISGIFEYVGDVIKQYQSFDFYNQINDIKTEKSVPKKSITTLKITDGFCNKEIELDQPTGELIRIAGENGTGKTTMLYDFLGVSYKGARSCGKIYGFNDNKLYPNSYRKSISFVAQAIPMTSDTIQQYFTAVTGSPIKMNLLVKDVLFYYDIIDENMTKFMSNLDLNEIMRALSGGQSKFIQILAAVSKLYINNYKCLVLDEPSNNLDVDKVECLKKIIKGCLSNGVIILMVTHDERLTDIHHETITLIDQDNL